VRLPAVLVLLLALAGCGSTASSSSYGEVTLVLGATPHVDELGVYLATARDFDTAEGVTLRLAREGPGDFRLAARPSGSCVAVMAIVRPAKLVLCVDPVTLDEQRPKAVAVARALRRGYTQAQLEPEEAVAVMVAQVPGLDADRLSAELDTAAAGWTAGARYFGELAPGPDRDPSIAADAAG
jgi:ABC-type nitrate/sulfonate/bicarbonate transport system substrate-binding protein